jgi:hypothetical protein
VRMLNSIPGVAFRKVVVSLLIRFSRKILQTFRRSGESSCSIELRYLSFRRSWCLCWFGFSCELFPTFYRSG